MDNFKQTRSCIHDCSSSESLISSGGSKQIRIPMNREQSEKIWKDSQISFCSADTLFPP